MTTVRLMSRAIHIEPGEMWSDAALHALVGKESPVKDDRGTVIGTEVVVAAKVVEDWVELTMDVTFDGPSAVLDTFSRPDSFVTFRG